LEETGKEALKRKTRKWGGIKEREIRKEKGWWKPLSLEGGGRKKVGTMTGKKTEEAS